MGEIANLIAELRRAASDANWVVMEADAQLMLRAATYLESLSAPVEDEEKVRLVSLALLRATCDHYGDPFPANPDLSLTNILARAAIAALPAPVGVTVGEPLADARLKEGARTVSPGHCKISFANGVRASVTWLHARAKEMNDAHAVSILNSAAFCLGGDLAQSRHATSYLSEAKLSGSPTSPKQTSELEALGCGSLK